MTQLTVDTLSGPIRGRRKEDVYLFSGIPYAAAPIDDLRFKPPQPHRPWTEVRDALKFGPAAPQTPGGGLTANAPVRWHEDCLTLNVSTPACDQERRAVLVWIHGGHYRTGQGAIPWYNGHSFNLKGDIVVVSINYRLGALGFTDLSHLGADYASSGYNGLLDQIAALRWVQDNISQFGGDPNKVTIAGESAGAFSVSTLLGCEQAQGLFRGAIAQSGAAHHTLEKAAAEKTAERFLNELGVSDVLSLAAIDVQRILDAQAKTCGALEGGTGEINQLGGHVAPFYPHHGNDLLPRSPIDAIRAGCGSDVAVLLGSNSQETTMWGFGKVDKHKLVAVASSLNAKHAIDVYRTQRAGADEEALLVALTSDHMFRLPAIRLAEARAQHTEQTWMYLFNWQSRALNGKLGATHALEIPFAFNNLERAGVDFFIGPGELPQTLADLMHSQWIQFVNHLEPDWERYQLSDRATMVFDDKSATCNDPHQAERLSWEGIR